MANISPFKERDLQQQENRLKFEEKRLESSERRESIDQSIKAGSIFASIFKTVGFTAIILFLIFGGIGIKIIQEIFTSIPLVVVLGLAVLIFIFKNF